MLAKAISNRPIGGSIKKDFRKRISYVSRSAELIETRNLAGTWVDAAFQMSCSAGLRPSCRMPSYHIVLAWSSLETPNRTQMMAAANRILEDLGAGGHQTVIALHLGRIPHVHIVTNRVHLLHGTLLSRSHDYARLESSCRKIEWENGWPFDRGRFLPVIRDGIVELEAHPESYWAARTEERERGVRRDPRSVRAHQRQTGLASLRDLMTEPVTRLARAVIKTATSWALVHEGLGRCGLRYTRHGSGARIVEKRSGAFMRACDLGSAYAFPRLKKALGAFVPDGKESNDRNLGEPSTVSNSRHQINQERAARRKLRDELMQSQKRDRTQLRATTAGFPVWLQRVFMLAQMQTHHKTKTDFSRDHPLPTQAQYVRAAESRLIFNVNQNGHEMRRETEARVKAFRARRLLDHTTCRQMWSLARESGHEGTPASGQDILIPRHARDGRLVDFDRLVKHPDGLKCRNVSRRQLGVAVLGPPAATACVVTDDLIAGIKMKALRPDLLIAYAGKTPTQAAVGELVFVTNGRPVCIMVSPGGDDFAEAIRERLPVVWSCATTDLSPLAEWRPFATKHEVILDARVEEDPNHAL